MGGRHAEKLVQLRAMTLRAVRSFVAANEQLELRGALTAAIFVQGHDDSPFGKTSLDFSKIDDNAPAKPC
jgi:hypothetical protein